jgi:N-formylglutamate amidohydrolase
MTENPITANDPWTVERGDQPIIATAIHAGHEVRPEVAALLEVTEEDRLREEDPFTDRWTEIVDNRVVVHRSRFEVDLNRPRDRAIYLVGEDAFGLNPWREEPAADVRARSLEQYDDFYATLRGICDELVADFGRFVLLDIHSYNHRRGGPDAAVDDPAANPEINLGTASMHRERWGAVVEGFIEDVAAFPFDGGHLDVRENVRFKGGFLSRWIHETYPETGCALAIEVKKIYMDEWTGVPDESSLVNLSEVFRSTMPGLLDRLG